MRLVIVIFVVVLGLAASGAAAVTFWPSPSGAEIADRPSDPKRGAYLLRTGGCVACHSAEGGELLSGGGALRSPFGSFYAPNITPDPDQGLGNWTLTEFAQAVRLGVRRDGAPYYPAFPYEFYAAFTDQDVADMWAALNAVPPSSQPSQAHDVPFPFSVRDGLRIWQTLFARPYQYEKETSRSASWNRGRYLVEGPAHCGACHTPRYLLGGLRVDESLAGNPAMMDGSSSPSLSSNRLEEDGWTVEGLARALRTGVLPDGDTFGNSMAEVVSEGTSFLLTQHLEDMARYLLDVDE